jgi:hypothetical protein
VPPLRGRVSGEDDAGPPGTVTRVITSHPKRRMCPYNAIRGTAAALRHQPRRAPLHHPDWAGALRGLRVVHPGATLSKIGPPTASGRRSPRRQLSPSLGPCVIGQRSDDPAKPGQCAGRGVKHRDMANAALQTQFGPWTVGCQPLPM